MRLYRGAMTEVVIVEAVRSPVGKRNGGLSSVHPTGLLSQVQSAAVERSGIDPAAIGQVVGGCVDQIGAQAMNVTRTAWLTAGLPEETACSTVDSQCGSSQHAVNLAYSLVKSGVEDTVLACGVESMSIVPIGSNATADGVGSAPSPATTSPTTSSPPSSRGPSAWPTSGGVTREGLRPLRALVAGAGPPERGMRAVSRPQIVPIEAPVLDENGKKDRRDHHRQHR